MSITKVNKRVIVKTNNIIYPISTGYSLFNDGLIIQNSDQKIVFHLFDTPQYEKNLKIKKGNSFYYLGTILPFIVCESNFLYDKNQKSSKIITFLNGTIKCIDIDRCLISVNYCLELGFYLCTSYKDKKNYFSISYDAENWIDFEIPFLAEKLCYDIDSTGILTVYLAQSGTFNRFVFIKGDSSTSYMAIITLKNNVFTLKGTAKFYSLQASNSNVLDLHAVINKKIIFKVIHYSRYAPVPVAYVYNYVNETNLSDYSEESLTDSATLAILKNYDMGDFSKGDFCWYLKTLNGHDFYLKNMNKLCILIDDVVQSIFDGYCVDIAFDFVSKKYFIICILKMQSWYPTEVESFMATKYAIYSCTEENLLNQNNWNIEYEYENSDGISITTGSLVDTSNSDYPYAKPDCPFY